MKRSTVRLNVRSRKIPVRVGSVIIPYPNSRDVAFAAKKSLVVYDYELDEGQKRVLADVRELAAESGMRLEVVDLTRESLVEKMSRKLSGMADRTPLLVLGRESNSLLNAFLAKVKPSGTGPATCE